MNIFIELIYHSPLIPIRRRDTERERNEELRRTIGTRERKRRTRRWKEIGEIERVPVFRSVSIAKTN